MSNWQRIECMNERRQNSTPRCSWRWGAVLVVMPILYVASYGPAVVAIIESGLVDNNTFMRCFAVAYYPLAWIARTTETETWMDGYASSCVRVWHEVLDL
jgi:hypothetical protein